MGLTPSIRHDRTLRKDRKKCVSWKLILLANLILYGIFLWNYYRDDDGSSSLSQAKDSQSTKHNAVDHPREDFPRIPQYKVPKEIRDPIVPYGGVDLQADSHLQASASLSKQMAIQFADPRNNDKVDAWYKKILQAQEEHLSMVPSFGSKRVQSCRRKIGTDSYSRDSLAVCRKNDQSPMMIYYFNPLPKNHRIICGKVVGPKQTLKLDQACMLPARLFPVVPMPDGKGMPPVLTRFGGLKGRGKSRPFPCDIPCLEAGEFSILNTRTIEGSPFQITMSMEGPEYYPSLNKDPQGWKQNKFWSTTSFDSDIPLPYYSKNEYGDIRAVTPVDFHKAIRGGSFMARNCHSMNQREKIIRELQHLSHSNLRIDSLSSCLQNAEVPPGVDITNKKSVMQQYLFHFAFENQCSPDYITEKVWGALAAGTLPVYFGAENIKDHVPINSIIDVKDFRNTEALFKHLEKVAQDEHLYMSYHEWRRVSQPHFDQKMNLTHTHATCRTCRWGYARMYGLGWNHEHQYVHDTNIERKVCLDSRTGLIQHPVVEDWGAYNMGIENRKAPHNVKCLKGTLSEDLLLIKGKANLQRLVRHVDGVVEIEIYSNGDTKSNGESARFSLQTLLDPSTTSSLVVRKGQMRLQDNSSRITVVSSPISADVRSQTNKIEVTIKANDLPLRIRLMPENIDMNHEGSDQEEGYFGKLMIKDFYYPVEAYFVP